MCITTHYVWCNHCVCVVVSCTTNDWKPDWVKCFQKWIQANGVDIFEIHVQRFQYPAQDGPFLTQYCPHIIVWTLNWFPNELWHCYSVGNTVLYMYVLPKVLPGHSHACLAPLCLLKTEARDCQCQGYCSCMFLSRSHHPLSQPPPILLKRTASSRSPWTIKRWCTLAGYS